MHIIKICQLVEKLMSSNNTCQGYSKGEPITYQCRNVTSALLRICKVVLTLVQNYQTNEHL